MLYVCIFCRKTPGAGYWFEDFENPLNELLSFQVDRCNQLIFWKFQDLHFTIVIFIYVNSYIYTNR